MLFRGITSLIQIFANNHNKTEIQLEWGEWTATKLPDEGSLGPQKKEGRPKDKPGLTELKARCQNVWRPRMLEFVGWSINI